MPHSLEANIRNANGDSSRHLLKTLVCDKIVSAAYTPGWVMTLIEKSEST